MHSLSNTDKKDKSVRCYNYNISPSVTHLLHVEVFNSPWPGSLQQAWHQRLQQAWRRPLRQAGPRRAQPGRTSRCTASSAVSSSCFCGLGCRLLQRWVSGGSLYPADSCSPSSVSSSHCINLVHIKNSLALLHWPSNTGVAQQAPRDDDSVQCFINFIRFFDLSVGSFVELFGLVNFSLVVSLVLHLHWHKARTWVRGRLLSCWLLEVSRCPPALVSLPTHPLCSPALWIYAQAPPLLPCPLAPILLSFWLIDIMFRFCNVFPRDSHSNNSCL